MKNRLLLLLSAPLWLACQSADSDNLGIDPSGNVYNDEAAPSRKLFCSTANCTNPYNLEQYTYNSAGKRIRTDYLTRNSSGKMESVSYEKYTYTERGQLVSRVRYGTYNNTSQWVPYDESEYVYGADGVLKTERTFFNQRNPEQRVLSGLIEYTFKDGKKIEQAWYDANNRLSRRVVNEYKGNVVIRETWYSNTGEILRHFTHSFAGTRRHISEHLPNSKDQIALIEKTYDKQGRLFSEETKVNNPLLCAMVAGMIRYDY